MRKKYSRKNKKNKKNGGNGKDKKIHTRKNKKGRKKSYKIMKGGSLAGNFFRFLAGENDRDRLRLKELKELDQYKKQQKIEAKNELNEYIKIMTN